MALRWQQETGISFPVLTDPERMIYQKYGLERSWVRSWNLRTIWKYIRLLSSGRKWRGILGDSAQLGADFVIDKNGIIQLSYYSFDPTDRPSISEILTVLQRLNS